MVVARFAMNKTMNATRRTTTPPTVIRSHKSEVLRIRLSLYRADHFAHFPHSTVAAEVCSDQGHILSFLAYVSSDEARIAIELV